jgi:hypothetical protein
MLVFDTRSLMPVLWISNHQCWYPMSNPHFAWCDVDGTISVESSLRFIEDLLINGVK